MGSFAHTLLFGVARVRTTFGDDLGSPPKQVVGTGFYLLTGDPQRTVFVTNKHNVDPRLSKVLGENWRTKKVELELRKIDGTNPTVIGEAVQWCEVSDLEQALFADDADDAPDCAVIADPTFVARPPDYRTATVLDESHLATEAELEEAFAIGDPVSFVGFPGWNGDEWWDTSWNFPISRPAWIASWPGTAFSNKAVKTADTLLLSGLSFSGSSGSPVVARATSRDTIRVVGVMSGHYWEKDSDSRSLLRHSGLSYLTRSTSIRALVERARATGYRTSTPFGGLDVSRMGTT
jgi:hypothetical protein